MAEAFTWHAYKQNGILQMSSPQRCNTGDLYLISEKDPEVCVVALFFFSTNQVLEYFLSSMYTEFLEYMFDQGLTTLKSVVCGKPIPRRA